MLRNIQEIYTSVPGSPLFASAQTDLKPAEKAFVGLLLFFLKKKMDLNNRCHYYSFFFFFTNKRSSCCDNIGTIWK